MSDRTVHAVCEDGREVVRYDRTGKWYIEHSSGRRAISVREAAEVAVAASKGGGKVYPRRPGGGRFDALVRHAIFRGEVADAIRAGLG